MDLKTFFQINPKVALGFSGGVDSSYLLSAAIANGADVKAYFAQTPFQPQFELEDAKRMAAQLKANWQVLELDVLQDQQAAVNNEQRCYFCKQQIFGKLAEQAKADGYSVIIDGTNASDDVTDRPGMRALQEMQVLSPLRECGITKAEIRQLSKEAGLFTWNKPAYACLATETPRVLQLHGNCWRKLNAPKLFCSHLDLLIFGCGSSEHMRGFKYPRISSSLS